MIDVSLILIIISSVIVFIRLFIGPRAEDRLVALDSGTTITTVLIVLIAYIYKRSVFFDVALVYAVLAFVSVIVATKYLKGEL